MSKWFCSPGILLVVGAMVLFNCGNMEKSDFPRAVIIVGEVELVRKGVMSLLVSRQYLRAGDTVRVRDGAKVKLELAAGAYWYVNKKTTLTVQPPVALSGEKRRLPVSLLGGMLHIVKRDESFEEYLVETASWKVRVTAADVTISVDSTGSGVTLLNGFATFAPAGGTETVIPVCNRLSVGDSGEGTLLPVTTRDVESVKEWVGSTVVDEAIAQSGCTVKSEATGNAPPVWQRLPQESASPGEMYCDTVEAVDPEQGALTYSLVKAPKGMAIDSRNGVLTLAAPEAGNHEVVIVATDNHALSCTAQVVINVSAGLSLRVWAPRRTEPGKKITIRAIAGGVDPKRVRYRFDLNGDGAFEIPRNGYFGTKAVVTRYAFPNEGVFRMVAEARGDDGKRVKAKRWIVINAPPVAVLKVVPETAATGMPVEFDLSGCTDSRNGTVPLKVRIDVDGNGTWDIPGGNEFVTEKKLVYAWQEPGIYTVTAQVTDKDGAASTATARVTVSQGIIGGSIKCPDSVHVGDSVLITCTPRGGEFPVKEYAWSFNGDTIFEQTTRRPEVYTVFGKAEIRSLLCRMTDEKGQRATATRVVVVINSASTVDAGGPYKVAINRKVVLTGSGSDRDSKITGYSWDFDGDGVIDWTSAKDTSVAHIYKKSGKYSARFSIATSDGGKAIDSALVEVVNNAPAAHAGEDIVSRKNRKVKLSGTAEDVDSNIVSYEWDFDGDGVTDWSSKENGAVEHEFSSYTEAVFRVEDSDGAAATDTIKIIICPDDMRTIEGDKFCIDAYEFPNKRNSRPQVNVTYEEAARTCKNLGKRLCTSTEWEIACNDGRERNNFPYGKKYEADKCNTLGNPRVKNSMANAGEFFECKTASGIYDMSGNVAEWTRGARGNPYATGGSWQNGEPGSGCGSKVQLQKGRKYFYVGFRCCK